MEDIFIALVTLLIILFFILMKFVENDVYAVNRRNRENATFYVEFWDY